ncbi:hypothetical protein AALP_AAs68684U000100 [Arabis alpina]|uniref:Uncharacterized protein n=1 Tax=Arabis alpina TaxID=50452 RepID=A0A087G189_ARAAL|nr:hypothetical protein AALP_AAs68684U000100 [Arabis alpina]
MGTESNNEADLDPRELVGVAFATDEHDDVEAAFCDEDRGDADKVITDELVGSKGENTDELIGTECENTDELGDIPTHRLGVVDEAVGVDVTMTHSGVKGSSVDDDGLIISTRGVGGPRSSPVEHDPRTTSSGSGRADDTDVVETRRVETEVFVGSGVRPVVDIETVETRHSLVTDGSLFVDDTDPQLPFGRADASSSSSSSDSGAFSDEDVSLEVGQTRKVKSKTKAKVCPDPPGSSLSDPKSLRRLRRHCGISEEIVLIAPTPADRADAPPAGYMTLFENYFDQCLLWFPLPRFLMRYLAVHGVCLAQINPRGIRHLLGIYVFSRECGVDISIENLSYLTDFRTRGLSEELKYSVANSSGMALIAGFPSKDDHFEYRFFFAEADCIDLVKTRWERRVKPTMPKVSKEFLAAMHKELSSGNGNWRRSFSRKRIERALSADILPRKVLGRGQTRLSLREQIALEAAAKARGSLGTGAPRVARPTTSTPPAPSTRARTSRPSAPKTALPPPSSGDVAEFHRLSAERARISSGKGKGVDRMTPSKRGSELSAAKEANAALQSRLNETVERNDALERDALALQRVKKDYEDKLSKLKSRCAKAEGETVRLRGELSSASDLQRTRIDAAVAETRDEMTRSFVARTSEVAGLLAEIGGKAQRIGSTGIGSARSPVGDRDAAPAASTDLRCP